MNYFLNLCCKFNIPPCLPFTFLLMLGIITQWAFAFSYIAIISTFFACAICIVFFAYYTCPDNLTTLTLLGLIFFLGICIYKKQIDTYKHFFISTADKSYTIAGVITEISVAPFNEKISEITLNIFKIRDNNLGSNWNALKKQIRVYISYNDELQVDDTIMLHNVTFKPSKNESFAQYLIKNGIAATIFLQSPQLTIIDRPENSVRRWIAIKKDQLIAAVRNMTSYETDTLYSCLFLGNRKLNKQCSLKLADKFKQWGLLHFLARSGIHLLLFIFIWQFLLNFIPINTNIKQSLFIVISVAYYLFSWPSIPFMRALFILVLYKIFIMLRQPLHFLHILSVICFVFLLDNPILLFSLDFQLSFVLTFALAWLGMQSN